jgi:multidrug efflux pump subunit AcrB
LNIDAWCSGKRHAQSLITTPVIGILMLRGIVTKNAIMLIEVNNAHGEPMAMNSVHGEPS